MPKPRRPSETLSKRIARLETHVRDHERDCLLASLKRDLDAALARISALEEQRQ